MPIQDFSLNTEGMQRVQVFWNSESKPAAVRLDEKVIGLLNTARERAEGKDFTLPDGSTLHVRFVNNQAQVTRNGSPLGNIRRVVRSARRPPEGKKLGGCLTTWLVVMLIGSGSSIITNFLQLIGVTKNAFFQPSPVFLLLIVLVNGAGIVSAIALFSWKKWGFYLFICIVLCDLVIYYLEHATSNYSLPSAELNTLSFIGPLIGIGILYWLLRRKNRWEQLA
ncbi:MAG: hypothetical protein M3Y39_16650 [Chloroflexota bacterium]|nr:hypothetical protein [Chloroflexota bacterium]